MTNWDETHALKLGDLVISIGRAFSGYGSTSRRDVGIVIGFDEEENLVKVHWQRSNRRVSMRSEWLMPVTRPRQCT